MIKARNYLFLAVAATLLLVGCQNGLEEESKGSSNVVTIRCNASSPSSSRIASYSTDYDQMRYFEVGDQVCVSTDGQEAVVYQCTNADRQTWAEADSSKFLLWTADEMTFKAYYPATEGTSMTAFTLPADQSSEAKIALADYMTSEQTCANVSDNNIYLDLERKTARVIVRISGFTDQYDNDKKTVSNVRIYSQYSTIDGYGYGNGDITAVTPYMQGTGGQGTSYTALVVPGYGDDGATFIQLSDGENNTLTVKGIPELEEGCSYTFNLTVGKNTIQVQSVTVEDWTGETLTRGQAEEQIIDYLALPFTLQAVTAGNIIVTSPQAGMKYSKNGATATTVENTADLSIDVAAGDTVAFYGNGTSITCYNGTMITGGTAQVNAYGNIMSLVDEEGFATATTLPADETFNSLFSENTNLLDASKLQLPATTLTYFCYISMFFECSSLTTAPDLPATTLADSCYTGMFSYCSSLTKAPDLPATTLANSCYTSMFSSCSNLSVAPALPATTLADSCYRAMFYSCSSLNSVTCLATDISANYCTNSWLDGVAATGTFTKAASMQSWPGGVSGIPTGWTTEDAN